MMNARFPLCAAADAVARCSAMEDYDDVDDYGDKEEEEDFAWTEKSVAIALISFTVL